MNVRVSPSIPLLGQAFISGFYSFLPPSIVTPSPSLETLGSMKNRRNILPSRLAGRGQSRDLFDGRPEVHYANQD